MISTKFCLQNKLGRLLTSRNSYWHKSTKEGIMLHKIFWNVVKDIDHLTHGEVSYMARTAEKGLDEVHW